MANAISLIKGVPGMTPPLGFVDNHVEMNIGESMPDIIVGSGAPDGDAAPFLAANKGSLYLRTDATDDSSHVYMKYDEGGDDNDWALVDSFSGTLASTVTVGEDDTGYDVKFFGATSGKSWLWDESADKMIVTGDSQFTGAVIVGVDDTGHDVKLFGATAGSFLLWDESEDQLELTDSTPLAFGDAADIVMQWDGTSFKVSQATANSAIELGVDGAGIDFKLFGDTAGCFWLWDQSADTVLRDGGTLFAKAVASGDGGMTVSADGMTADPETAAEAGYIAIDIAGTGYQIPIYAA